MTAACPPIGGFVALCSLRALFTYHCYSMALTRRIGRLQPFARVNEREDARYTGLQVGVTTYHGDDDDETYLVSYAEIGGRSDHISKPIGDLFGVDDAELKTSEPLAGDEGIVSAAPAKDEN